MHAIVSTTVPVAPHLLLIIPKEEISSLYWAHLSIVVFISNIAEIAGLTASPLVVPGRTSESLPDLVTRYLFTALVSHERVFNFDGKSGPTTS